MINKKAQSTLEYALLFCIVVVALISMQVYIKRGIQGRLRARVDELSNRNFYSPGATHSDEATNYVTKNITEHSDSGTSGDVIFGFFNKSETTTTSDRVSSLKEDTLSFADEPARKQ